MALHRSLSRFLLPLSLGTACGAPGTASPGDSCAAADSRWAELEAWTAHDCLSVLQEVEETDMVRGRTVAERLEEMTVSGEVSLDNAQGISTAPQVTLGRLYGRLLWDFSVGCGVSQGMLTGLVEMSVQIEELGVDAEGNAENVRLYVWEDRTFMTADLLVPAEGWSGEDDLRLRITLEPGQPVGLHGTLQSTECVLFYTRAGLIAEDDTRCR